MAPSQGFFHYRPHEAPVELVTRIKLLCVQAEKRVGKVDGIVLPEMALSREEFDQVRMNLIDTVDFIVGGVYKFSGSDKPALNYALCCRSLGKGNYVQVEQHKHHRWYLDSPQITRYGLGANLDPSVKWWEFTSLRDRRLHFVALNSLISFCVMICEDLSRPDPVGDLVRAVGPNLVVALLADGPQLSSRWAARYATVLTDDPGSSVLTVTSLGMATLSQPDGVGRQSRIVALWRDRDTGTRELELPSEHHGLLLSLTCSRREEFTADGRSDGTHSGFLRLSGVQPLSWK